jgi:exodeoxyribonuclease V gamma subunit
MSDSHLNNGLAVIHSNKLESLADVVKYWLSQHPLSPLENDVFLVNNNGMGHWIKQTLAHNQALGIAAGIEVVLPSSFIWRVYRQVLGEKIPQEQILAKSALIWRLYRLLPELVNQNGFEILERFLTDDPSNRKRYQLAEQLADLFDQYQVYRSDWLADWEAGRDQFADGHGVRQDLPDAQRWQALLWRAILADLGDANTAAASRASVHAKFMAQVDHSQPKLPRRVVVFGVSSLPQQSLEVLVKISKFCQVVLFVNNPCQHYWADIIEDKELLKAASRRQKYKDNQATNGSITDLHQYANPLLAAWGKQGRDYIRLLDAFDDQSIYKDWGWPDNKIDLFEAYGHSGHRSLLQQIQDAILDLQPVPEKPHSLNQPDQSLEFHIAHSRQREVEILHDQLLARFNAAAKAGKPLHPRDVIVMVPDINSYAPHINAVFGQIKTNDKRYIPFSLADQNQRGQNPLLNALESLLKLPESRFSVSECLALLEVPALRKKFAIDETALPKLQQWIHESGVRWGLNQQQRQAAVAMPEDITANTWEFGLQRMLLGYAVGAGQRFNAIEPYAEIGGLDAQWLGSLASLLEKLESTLQPLTEQQSVAGWVTLLQQLLDDFFDATHDQERQTLGLLNQTLLQLKIHWGQGGLKDDALLPVHIVREAWLSRVDEPSLQQRFLSGRVNFCTLMPMRAIPFRLVCLLGMNDGDYPRSHQPQSFDLMSLRGHYRPGDRSRRQDDQYLFLEALLSAREQLYISWVGRSIRDNSERPASVLVSQLRDYVGRGWELAGHDHKWLEAITLSHPLQAFSQAYIQAQRDQRLFTYSKEWFEGDATKRETIGLLNNTVELPEKVSVEALGRFLKEPVKTFCQSTLKCYFDDDHTVSEDHEAFEFDHLENYLQSNALLAALKQQPEQATASILQQQYASLMAQGQLPLAGFSKLVFEDLSGGVVSAWQRYQSLITAWPKPLAPQTLVLKFKLETAEVELTGDLLQLHENDAGAKAILSVVAQALLKKDAISYHRLMPDWVRHLAACAAGLAVTSLIVSADAILKIEPLDAADAHDGLQNLLSSWHTGLQAPLPVEIKTASVGLAQGKPQDMRKKYEGADSGADWSKGVVDYDAYLRRFFPDFDALNPGHPEDKSSFDYWANRLYKTAFEQIKPVQGESQ